MKKYQIFVFGLLLVFIYSTCPSNTQIPSTLKDCGELSDGQKKAGIKCCIVTTNLTDIKTCVPLTKEQYNSAKDGIVAVGNVEYKYECFLPHLKFGLLNLIFFALWI